MKFPLLSLLSLLGIMNATAGITPGSKDLGPIWFIGDSITQSNADGDVKGSPRKSLYDLLTKNGYTFSYTGHHAKNPDGLPESVADPADNLYHYHSGVSGIRIGEVGGDRGFASILEKSWNEGRLATAKPNVILIMLGTNDVGMMENAPDRLRKLVTGIYALPDVGEPTVFLATVPPNRRTGQERFADDRENVAAFNGTILEMVKDFIAEGKDIHFVDQFTPLDDNYAATMRPDNLHPNATGNDTMAQTWFDAISNVVGEKPAATEQAAAFPGKKSDFKGHDRYDIKTEKGSFAIICPKKAAPGKPWLWRSLFWEQIKKFHEADLQLVDEGYHIVLAHGNVHGHPSGNKNIDAAYEYVTQEHGFAKKCSMASMSRGTLSLFTWAAINPEKVSSIYVDNGVCNVDSWPGGKPVEGSGSIASGASASWKGMKEVYGFTTDQELLDAEISPIDKLEPLAKAGVPILIVCGSKDPAVPYEENDAIMEERYKELGGEIQVIIEDKGHTHGMDDPTPVLEFIKKHTE
ncbi:MAG: GDSL-type esterase/lipase family protein [Luteolibacter sp.]